MLPPRPFAARRRWCAWRCSLMVLCSLAHVMYELLESLILTGITRLGRAQELNTLTCTRTGKDYEYCSGDSRI